MNNRSIAAVLSATAVSVLLTSSLAANAAVPGHPHPPITDVAGDATTVLGLNVAGADVRSADLRIVGQKLVATLKTTATARAGSGPASNFDHAPYMISGVFSDANGQAVPFRVTLNPGGRAVLAITEDNTHESTTTSTDGLSRASFPLAEINPISYLSQGITARTQVKSAAAFAEVNSATGKASDRTDNVDFVLGG